MGWPLSQDYNEAIQNAATSFADPELRDGEAVGNALGIPMPRSGTFADVYEMRSPTGSRWAVKCFTRAVPGLRERYLQISRALLDARLPFMVDFTYLEQGIRVRGCWYPILKMQWVAGLTFNEFLRQNLDKPDLLENLLLLWMKLAWQLRAAGIAHADLQHGNILLVPGSTPAGNGADVSLGNLLQLPGGTTNAVTIKLIDYDGMFVPALAGQSSGEVGHPAYQHPQRVRERISSAEVDRFPLLLIATALRSLCVGGRTLWARYDNGDNLLFRESDLTDPDRSLLFRELFGLRDVRSLVGVVRRSLAGPLARVPLLEEVLPDLAAAARGFPVALNPPGSERLRGVHPDWLDDVRAAEEAWRQPGRRADQPMD